MKTVLRFINYATQEATDCGDPLEIEISSRDLGWTGVLLEKGYSPHFHPNNIVTPYFYFALGIEADFTWKAKIDNSLRALKTSPGEIWINPPDAPFTHSIDEPCYFIILAVDENIMYDAFPGRLPRQKLEFLNSYNITDEYIKNIINMFYTEVLNRGRNGELFVVNLLRLFASYFITNYSNYNDLHAAHNSVIGTAEMNHIDAYIEDNIEEIIKIEDIAEMLEMTKFSFLKEFKLKRGITPYQYILKKKMDYAENLLKNTDRAIIEIAFDLGFSDQSHFTNTFKKYFGVSPGKYR